VAKVDRDRSLMTAAKSKRAAAQEFKVAAAEEFRRAAEQMDDRGDNG
jgi:hypothetical protein